MPKPELEIFDPDLNIPWRQVEGAQEGIIEKILSLDPDTGSYTRLLKFPPGMVTTETLTHDFWEEVYVLEGTLIDLKKELTFIKGMYACRPPAHHSPVPPERGVGFSHRKDQDARYHIRQRHCRC